MPPYLLEIWGFKLFLFSRITNDDTTSTLKLLKAMLHIKSYIALVFRHTLNIQIILILLFNQFNQMPGNTQTLILWIYKYIMHIRKYPLSSSTRTKPQSFPSFQALMAVLVCIKALYNRFGYSPDTQFTDKNNSCTSSV